MPKVSPRGTIVFITRAAWLQVPKELLEASTKGAVESEHQGMQASMEDLHSTDLQKMNWKQSTTPSVIAYINPNSMAMVNRWVSQR